MFQHLPGSKTRAVDGRGTHGAVGLHVFHATSLDFMFTSYYLRRVRGQYDYSQTNLRWFNERDDKGRKILVAALSQSTLARAYVLAFSSEAA